MESQIRPLSHFLWDQHVYFKMLSREYKAILIIEQIFLIGSYPWITWLGGYLIQYIESTVVAKVMDFFLGNIFEWNLSEIEAEGRPEGPPDFHENFMRKC